MPALLANEVPAELASYTTITFAVDMVIAPVLVISESCFDVAAPAASWHLYCYFIDALGTSLLVMGIVQQIAGLMNIDNYRVCHIFVVLTFFT
jgi:hypothetical protein